MTYAREIEGYELVKQRTELFRSGNFIPVGDPAKAAKVMVELVDHPEPPIHLVLGSEAFGMLKAANAGRDAEMEKWKDVSLSTDHEDAEDFLSTTAGQFYIRDVQRKQ
jgi:hypothetical protein